MPVFSTSDALSIRYETAGDRSRPALILSNSLGTNVDMWLPQMAAFTERFFVVRYDKRGHGQSELREGPTTFERLTTDAIELLDHLNIRKAHWCGLSMGGMSGMWASTHFRERLDRVVLANTAPMMGPPDLWNGRIRMVLSEGMTPLIPPIVDRWFTKRFQGSNKSDVARVVDMLKTTPPQGYAACCAAIRDMDQRESIRTITNPVLVISGTHDGSTPPEHGKFIASAIPNAKYVEFDAAHLSNIEQPAQFTKAVLDHLSG